MFWDKVFERNAVHDLRPLVVALSLEVFEITRYTMYV